MLISGSIPNILLIWITSHGCLCGVKPEDTVARADLAPAFATGIPVTSVTPWVTDLLASSTVDCVVPFCVLCTLVLKGFLLLLIPELSISFRRALKVDSYGSGYSQDMAHTTNGRTGVRCQFTCSLTFLVW